MTTQEIIDDLSVWIPLSPALNEFINRAFDKLEAAESEIATQKILYALSLKRIDELLKELHEVRVELARHKKN